MGKPLIKRVDDNQEKSKTYSVLISKYNEALKNGFYGEAELLVYAFLEDRLRAFIYYSNLLSSFNSNNVNENGEIIYGNKLDIKNISNKITIVENAINSTSKKTCDMDPFEKDLKKIYTASIKAGEMKNRLNLIKKWCKYRNEIVHALFNKNLKDLRKGYEMHVKDGMELARYIDAQVKALKKA